MPSSNTLNGNRAKVRTGNSTLNNRSRPVKGNVTHNPHSNSGIANQAGALSNSRASSKAPGKIIAHVAGTQITAAGNSAVAITAIEFQTPTTADTLGQTTDFEFTVVPSSS